jgi:hypothetical protein
MDGLKWYWVWMLEKPWHEMGPITQATHWRLWLLGWTWTIAGLVIGALVAPPLVQSVGLANTAYQDALVIGAAVLAAFLVQLLGWSLVAFLEWLDAFNHVPDGGWSLFYAVAVLSFAGISYAFYRYFTWVGAGQRSITVAFVGGLLVKTFLIPLIKGIVTGALFKWFMTWLRGGKPKSA